MRVPSFIKVPRNRRFEIEPRYYDPVKEEIEERTRRIKAEVDNGSKEDSSTGGRISFERKTSTPDTSFLQLLIAAVLGLLVVGWLFYGNNIFYALWAVVPIYLFFRLRKKGSGKK